MPSKFILPVILCGLLFMAACGGASEPILELPTAAVLPSLTPSTTPTETTIPTDIPEATATQTVVPSETAIPTITPTFTPTADVFATEYFATEYAKQTQIAENQALLQVLQAIPTDLLPSATPTEIPLLNIEATLYYTVDPARIRTCARTDNDTCPLIREIPRGASIIVTGQTTGDVFRDSDQWYRVQIDNREGYVHTTLLTQTVPIPTPLPEQLTATANAQQSS